MTRNLEITFVEPIVEAYIKACGKILQQGINGITLKPFNELAAAFANTISAKGAQAQFYVAKEDIETSLPPHVQLRNEHITTEATFLFIPNARGLSLALMEYVDLKQGTLVAPITKHYYKNRPLFLISIPKSGTHLLYNLVERFGYDPGVVCPDHPNPGTWYCIEYSNSHTSAKDFFVDTVRRSPFGNRDHPFLRSPAIFIYRNPMDILVSEASYYHKEGKTAFFPYLGSKSFQERLITLIDDPWLLGSIRQRIGNYLPWLDFQNVIPVSFEELVGPKGGGSMEAQVKLIWSLQLKLHIPGDPRDYGQQVFDRESPTFREGRVGGYKKDFTKEAYEKFLSLPQDFMHLLGYDLDSNDAESGIPKRTEEFRTRHMVVSETDFQDTPIGVEYDFLGYNIVKYKGRFWGIPLNLKRLDLSNKRSIGLLKKTSMCQATDLNSLKQKIYFRSIPRKFFPIAGFARRAKSLIPGFLTHMKQ